MQPPPPNLWVFGWHQIASMSNHFEAQRNLLLQKIWELLNISRVAQRLLIQFHCDFATNVGSKKGGETCLNNSHPREKETGHWYFLRHFCDKIVPGGPECFFQSALGHAPASSCYCMCGMRWHYCSAPYGPERCELWRLIKSKEWEVSKKHEGHMKSEDIP